ncbi:MAG: BrxA/BrxB family bacilliredoxin [Planctomycetes bacterium]|nr:BrxA/BrxB family bacilliredoxin [Planctomycetota bacterium]
MPYDERLVAPMRAELTTTGVQELRSGSEVESFFQKNPQGTTLVVINSVCGCAAGSARPGVVLALRGAKKPDRAVTVFAGQDTEATARVRALFGQVPPSSPSIGLMKDGALVHFVPRHQIEGKNAEQLASDLGAAFAKYC